MSFIPLSSVISYSRHASVRPVASAVTLASIPRRYFHWHKRAEQLKGTPFRIAPALPLIRQTGNVEDYAAENRVHNAILRSGLLHRYGSASRFNATAVASISMCPISSVAVCSNISRYFWDLVVPHPWKKY